MSYIPEQDRRRGRSNDTFVSLCRLLDATRRARGLSAVALADTSGCLVAGSGAAQLCEELAALSTIPANDPRLGELGFRGEKPPVRYLSIDGYDVALTALGAAEDDDYARLSDGCRRILTENVGHSRAR
ncbi:MAG: hypothetical protein EOO73_25900 [Myxococcales bacterium]|nr:MAG: hypothetical protein EOO73_25900 [Myxococcales bacterium]